MVKGRRRLSSEVHEMNGTYKVHPERRNKNEPEPIKGCPPIPDSLEGDPVAIAKWNHVTRLLSDMRCLAVSDADLLEAYCITYSHYRKALTHVRTTGIVLVKKSSDGVSVSRNPFSVELHKYMQQMHKLLAEMGLTPASRSKLHAAPKEEEADPFQQLLDKMAGTG